MTDHPAAPTIDAALGVLAATREAASSNGRDDLASRLDEKAASLRDPSFHVLVVGEFKQGKSSLINALVAQSVCPVDDDIATAVPTVLRWSEDPAAEVLFQSPPAGDDRPEPVREPIAVEDVPQYASERAERTEDDRSVHSVEIGLPSRLLSGGLVLVDTPGVGGLGSTHGAVTAAAIPMAEAVIFVTDASQEFTAPELEFMQATRKLCPNIVCLVTKTDFYPEWRRIRDLNAAHLERMGLDAPIIATSAALHASAVAGGDGNLLVESGYPELTAFIRKEILGSAVALSVGAAASDLHDVIDQMTEHFVARRAVLEDPEAAQEKIRELEAAQARADELRTRSARWQTTLADGMADLNSDVDHDLRDRFRKITSDGEEALDGVDPADVWDEFEPWLYHRTATEVVRNYEFLQQRSRDLAARVAQHFEDEAAAARIDLDVIDPQAALGRVQGDVVADLDRPGAGQQMMMAMRGGMGGFMMFGMLGAVVGIALTPLGVGLGVVLGRKQMREEKDRALTQRRLQAKSAQRKYIEEATFRTSKDARDALRLIQRQIRDYFTARAEEQSTTMQEMLVAVRLAAQADQQERTAQLGEVNAEITRLDGLRRQVDALGAEAPQFGSAASAT